MELRLTTNILDHHLEILTHCIHIYFYKKYVSAHSFYTNAFANIYGEGTQYYA